jgi:hypothetical protein
MSTFVLFIGGYLAKIGDINLWKASAGDRMKDWTLDGYPWPPSAKDSESAIAAFKDNNMTEAIAKIVDGKYDQVYIIGHSSGCAIANKLDETLAGKLKDNSNVNLVALDGFAPSKTQRNRENTQVWCADGGKNRSHKSLNYPSLKGIDKLKMYPAQNCTNKWSLHFSLVNTTTSDKTVKSGDDIGNGYLNCRANLCWAPASP